MRNNKKKGFTLVELLVVIAIIAILATVSVVGYTAFIGKANDSNAKTEAKQVEQAINATLMTDEEYVIATVVTPAVTGENPVDESSAKYVVKADGKVYVYVDDAETATLYTENGDLDKAFDANADFAGLKGEFKVENGVITYTYEGITIKLDIHD